MEAKTDGSISQKQHEEIGWQALKIISTPKETTKQPNSQLDLQCTHKGCTKKQFHDRICIVHHKEKCKQFWLSA